MPDGPRREGTAAGAAPGAATPEGTSASLGLLGAGTGLVVGALAAVGVSGDLLARMVRNDPTELAWVVGTAIVAVAVAAIGTLVVRTRRPAAANVMVLGSLLVLAGMAILAVHLGASSMSDREVPGLSVTVASSEDGSAHIEADASASSMRSGERLLLLVGLLHPEVPHGDLFDACNARPPMFGGNSPIRELVVAYSGPDAQGNGVVSIEVPVDTGTATHACAYAAVPARGAVDLDGERPYADPVPRTSAVVRLPQGTDESG